MKVIEISHITKDYGHHKGVFDVSFHLNKGEVVGFLGPNGAGKTTTIRQLMGFIKPDQGRVSIMGMDCFTQRKKVQDLIGYLPGEIAFMDEMSGLQFIEFMANMKGIKEMQKAKELIAFLKLDANVKIKKMSKGMKQKIGLVIAFMQDAPVLLLDEPTSGLDPLMQQQFVSLIQKEKQEGKTILMSSHIFEEIEHTCDRVIMIKDGSIIADEKMEQLKHNRYKRYEIVFKKEEDAICVAQKYHGKREDKQVSLLLQMDMNAWIKELQHYELEDMNIRSQSLEELFLHNYGGDAS